MSGELLELPQGCQGPFRWLKREDGINLRPRSRKGPHLTLKREYPGFSRVAAGNVEFYSSYDRDPANHRVALRNLSLMRFANVLSVDNSRVSAGSKVLI